MAVVGNWYPTGNDQQRLTQQLRLGIDQLARAQAALQSIVGIQAQMVGGGNDYSTVEHYFSLDPGSGQSVKDLIGSCVTAMEGPDIQGLLSRLG